MLTNKTLLIVSISKLKKEIQIISKILEEKLPDKKDGILINLSIDLSVLVNLFQLSNNNEFEMLVCACTKIEIVNHIDKFMMDQNQKFESIVMQQQT